MIKMDSERIVQFGNRFLARMDSGLVQGALDYVNYNEVGLAFEILCDHICEYEVQITLDEYAEAMRLAKDMEIDFAKAPYKHMKELIR